MTLRQAFDDFLHIVLQQLGLFAGPFGAGESFADGAFFFGGFGAWDVEFLFHGFFWV
ncbi:Uncharacterised protein [Mycobacterium tuberculosis]|nr:Uncharacterised protein [Mycobacterium tuberculosis]